MCGSKTHNRATRITPQQAGNEELAELESIILIHSRKVVFLQRLLNETK